eukprot:TRINITY_DN2148_c0_g1_i2.p1 TRINITY_DN2148_c0_g1~~TRINITY_DN2148_c0_g1_i2.p1  ORF type:complete len:314 (+),score=141.59 TRINITY_DN2148_c0_g1_i2:731-1672(+)
MCVFLCVLVTLQINKNCLKTDEWLGEKVTAVRRVVWDSSVAQLACWQCRIDPIARQRSESITTLQCSTLCDFATAPLPSVVVFHSPIALEEELEQAMEDQRTNSISELLASSSRFGSQSGAQLFGGAPTFNLPPLDAQASALGRRRSSIVRTLLGQTPEFVDTLAARNNSEDAFMLGARRSNGDNSLLPPTGRRPSEQLLLAAAHLEANNQRADSIGLTEERFVNPFEEVQQHAVAASAVVAATDGAPADGSAAANGAADGAANATSGSANGSLASSERSSWSGSADGDGQSTKRRRRGRPVSYTHLTLPTIA